MNGFEKIINKINPESKVLDAGGWGLEGVNTTQLLIDRFGEDNVITLNKDPIDGKKIDIIAEWYSYKPEKKYDVVVVDVDLDDNVKITWTTEEFHRMFNLFLKERGILILYIRTTRNTDYQDVNFKEWDIFGIFPEGRRLDIVWVAFQKTV